MKHRFGKLLISLIMLFACTAFFGVAHASWAYDNAPLAENTAQVAVPTWQFNDGPDFAKVENVSNCSYLIASEETSILSPSGGSSEAVRFTNTSGTQNKTHGFTVSLDRTYTLGEIRFQKVEFDYYHAQKRQQSNKGFPKVQLVENNVNRGTNQGGGDTINDKAPFIATHLNEDWWHLEYFITALAPTMADHGDTPIGLSTRINGIKITDDNVYDHDSMTAFFVVDNLRFSSAPASRLGLFNRTTSFASGGYYWFKVAWAGELQSVDITFSDDTIAEYTPSASSPFYIRGLRAGSVTVTATLSINDGNQILSISNAVRVT